MPRPLGPLFDLVACFSTPSVRLRARNVLALAGGGEDRVAYRRLLHDRSACGRLGHEWWRGYRTLTVVGVGCVASKYLRLHRDGSYLERLGTSDFELLGASNLEQLGTRDR